MSGATSIEYGLVAALVALGCILSLGSAGQHLVDAFGAVTAGFEAGSTGSPPASTPNAITGHGP